MRTKIKINVSFFLFFSTLSLIAQNTFPEGEIEKNVIIDGGQIDFIAPDKNPNLPSLAPNFFESGLNFYDERNYKLGEVKFLRGGGAGIHESMFIGRQDKKGIYIGGNGNVYIGYPNGIGLFGSAHGKLAVKGVSLFDGKVGIGTRNPKNELSVKGTIWAQEVIVSLTDAADWVFADDYKLKPLVEVEAFIKRNKHLPEMPSANDFRANDMKVSEMTNRLLQKIEELTLYTIEQEKQLKQQTKQLKQQTKKLEEIDALKKQNKALEARMAKLEALLVK